MDRLSYKISDKENFYSYKIVENIVKETDVKVEVVEEQHSELWFETLNGQGKIFFGNNNVYQGNVKFGILDSDQDGNQSTLIFADGTKYEGDIKNNRLTGKGKYTFPSGAM